jgi:hypothetical protein
LATLAKGQPLGWLVEQAWAGPVYISVEIVRSWLSSMQAVAFWFLGSLYNNVQLNKVVLIYAIQCRAHMP